jgi:hypothetical protein
MTGSFDHKFLFFCSGGIFFLLHMDILFFIKCFEHHKTVRIRPIMDKKETNPQKSGDGLNLSFNDIFVTKIFCYFLAHFPMCDRNLHTMFSNFHSFSGKKLKKKKNINYQI